MNTILSIIPTDDGYTESAYIAAVPGIHGEHRVRYRPMTHQQRYVIGSGVRGKSAAESSNLVASAVAGQIVEWDVRDAGGQLHPITPSGAARLKPMLLERLYAIVSGSDSGDVDPNSAADDDALDLELQAVLAGRQVGELREEADAKN